MRGADICLNLVRLLLLLFMINFIEIIGTVDPLYFISYAVISNDPRTRLNFQRAASITCRSYTAGLQ